LITHQFHWLSEGHHSDSDAAPLELAMLLLHLAEMRLARQSCQVPEKNQQKIFVELASEIGRLAV